MEPVIVVGAGLAGVTCAQTLTAAGVPVVVLERSHRPGGRMSSPRQGERRVDLGASYLTVSDPRFEAQVAAWQEVGLARPWTDTFLVRSETGGWGSKQGPLRWGAPAGLRSLVEHGAIGLDLRQQEVGSVDVHGGRLRVDGVGASAVVFAMPDPQARRLLSPELSGVAEALTDPYEPILALATTWPERQWELDGVFVNGDPVLSWVADDGRRRGDGAAVLVAHSTPAFAAEHLERPDEAGPDLVAALRRLLDLSVEPTHAMVHRWTFARPTQPHRRTYLLEDVGGGFVACCGDAWSESAKVESAFLSGRELGEALTGSRAW